MVENNLEHTLPFPSGIPKGYLQLQSEPKFCAAKHLQLEQPEWSCSLHKLGYSAQQITKCPSKFGVSSAFRILSDEGLAIARDLCKRMYKNRNSSLGTGNNRLGSYIRGAGYRSRFVRDFCDSPELAEHLSQMADVSLARHSVPAVACGINYAPEDINRAVDSWHTDSVAFDIVLMLSDPKQIEGGEFQYFEGTKHDGQALLGISGEEGTNAELPTDQVKTISFPAAGYGFMQQGNMIFHRACKLKKKAERITMIPSFVVSPVRATDATNSINMSNWEDPGIVPELARHEAWRAAARLQALVDEISLKDDPKKLVRQLDEAVAPLTAFTANLDKPCR